MGTLYTTWFITAKPNPVTDAGDTVINTVKANVTRALAQKVRDRLIQRGL